MSEWLTRVINENQEIGLKKGRAEGSLNTLAALVRKNVITLKEAAEQAEMSEATFCEKTGLPLPQ